ncbi:MAG: type 2 isopentenyl-diphosphate Delta-isomerase [Ignavibacteriales bacterium]|nr:MAG: type 2 isopentenyl-diphosphate Delta-isomerase [Ignavibacteriales bacterium]
MSKSITETSKRKKEHIELCLTDKVAFRSKTNGFDRYDFIHNALTEVDISNLSFQTKLFSKKIKYPFLISCMTGGTEEAENINQRLAVIAEELKIPIGVGSQRQALENKDNHHSYKVIRKTAKSVPVLGNIGAAQLVKSKNLTDILSLIDMLEADAFVVHLNPLQELLQPEGDPYFVGLLKKIEKLILKSEAPVIVKEVGSGISKHTAKRLLDIGVNGIDVAGAGGTSWAGVEIIRSKSENDFWDWGLPTSYCLREIYPLKKKYKFTLIGSGGINSANDLAFAFAFGADLVASARIILQTLMKNGDDEVTKLIINWFEYLKKIMFLTGSENLTELKNGKIIKKEELF